MYTLDNFIKELKDHRHDISKQTLKTIRGIALSGEVERARYMLDKALTKKQDKADTLKNAHRSTRYMIRKYNDIDYKAQLEISLRSAK